MPAHPGVSVVVPHYGPPALTLVLVDQLRSQTYASMEVIVSDDCSPEPFPQTEGVHVVRRETNGGFGAAVNSGAAAATHDLLLILNSDLEVGRTFVADLVAASAPWQPAVTAPLLRNADGSAEVTGARFPTASAHGIEWVSALHRFEGTSHFQHAVGRDARCTPGATVTVDWLVGAALLIPRAVFHEVGGFDAGYFMNCEEVDLQHRLRTLGVPSVFIGSVEAVHVGGGSSDPARRRRWLMESRHRYAAQHGFARRLKVSLMTATVLNAATNTVRAAMGRPVSARETARDEWTLARGGTR